MSTNKESSNRKARVASAAIIAALLFGGGGLTLAQWSDKADTEAATIQAGYLRFKDTGTVKWYDASSAAGAKTTITKDNAETGTPITDITAFRTVPGDTLVRVQSVTPELQGNNLKAKLSLDTSSAASGTLLAGTGGTAADKGVTVEYKLIKADGSEVAGTDSGVTAIFVPKGAVPTDANFNKGTAVEVDGTAAVKLVTTVYFDVSTPDKVRQEATAELAAGSLKLDQVRYDEN